MNSARRFENGEEIFTIVDDHGPMQLDVKVHERAIDQIERGLMARIKFDAFPGESFTGTVSEVAVLPDPICFFDGFVKTYTVKVQIGHAPAGLCPGMTAEVEILTNDLENVLSVPVEAVVHENGKGARGDPAIRWPVRLARSDSGAIERSMGRGQRGNLERGSRGDAAARADVRSRQDVGARDPADFGSVETAPHFFPQFVSPCDAVTVGCRFSLNLDGRTESRL